MRDERRLILVGASTRAAAFSALRAGLPPWGIDLFADADLQAHCPVTAISARDYPHRLVEMIGQAPPGPVMYTGALENWPTLIARLARNRPLWGNPAAVLKQVRSPIRLRRLLHEQDIPCPEIVFDPHSASSDRRWLRKPVKSAGGAGICLWNRRRSLPKGTFLQEYIEGESCSAVYVGGDGRAELLGVTQQLVGLPWLHAGPFRYCGSVGPLSPSPALRKSFLRLGQALVEGFGLRGLFGVDCVLRDGVPYAIEVNPRYTASVEVMEYASGRSAMIRHVQSFGGPNAPVRFSVREAGEAVSPARVVDGFVGKAVFYAPRDLCFPHEGPWSEVLAQPGNVSSLPSFADIPRGGQRIRAGRPALTVFAWGTDLPDCLRQLQEKAETLPLPRPR